MSTIINMDVALANLQAEINSQIAEAVEPIIQKAVQEAEVVIRKRVGEMVVGMIQSDYSIERMGNMLRIDVRLVGK